MPTKQDLEREIAYIKGLIESSEKGIKELREDLNDKSVSGVDRAGIKGRLNNLIEARYKYQDEIREIDNKIKSGQYDQQSGVTSASSASNSSSSSSSSSSSKKDDEDPKNVKGGRKRRKTRKTRKQKKDTKKSRKHRK